MKNFHGLTSSYIQHVSEAVWLRICRCLTKFSKYPVIRLGSEYGGWNLYADRLNADSIVYSVGIGEDISFDLELIKMCGCHLFAFDPTPRSVEWLRKQNIPHQFKNFEIGLANYDGTALFSPPENPEHVSHTIIQRPSTSDRAITVPVKKISTVMRDLAHKKIDLLKMDIEGAEYLIIDEIISHSIDIDQILVEYHHFFPNIGLFSTIRCVFSLFLKGYRLFAISSNGHEYSFIKKIS